MNVAVTISGSFKRHLLAVMEAVVSFSEHGLQVLSPNDPRTVEEIGAFRFVASDRYRSIRLVEDVHLDAIRRSSFLWLVCPDGYVGQSVSLEMGFAIAHGVPVYSVDLPPDLTLRQYVHRVETIDEAIADAFERGPLRANQPSLLLDPDEAVASAHQGLDDLLRILKSGIPWVNRDIAPEVRRRWGDLVRMLTLPRRPSV